MATRLYFQRVREWHASEGEHGFINRLLQFEVRYKDYNEQGELVGCGTEDFTPERWRDQTVGGWVYGWDGNRRNKGGHKWWEVISAVHYRRGERKAVIALYKTWRAYRNFTEIEMRSN